MKALISILMMLFFILLVCTVVLGNYTEDFLRQCETECRVKTNKKKCKEEILDISVAIYFSQDTDDIELKRVFAKIARDKMLRRCPRTIDIFYKERN